MLFELNLNQTVFQIYLLYDFEFYKQKLPKSIYLKESNIINYSLSNNICLRLSTSIIKFIILTTSI